MIKRAYVVAGVLISAILAAMIGTVIWMSSDTGRASVAGASRPSATVTALPAITMSFTQHGDHPDVVLAVGIDKATTRVDAALYGLNRALDVDALINAQTRCKCVRLISDATQSGGAGQKAAMTRMLQSGIPIKVDHHAGLMHMKVVAVDQSVIYEGSFNATGPASTVNDEVLFSIASPDLARAFGDEFDAMWNNPTRYTNWTPSTPITPKPAE